jgi:hypothetical protein
MVNGGAQHRLTDRKETSGCAILTLDRDVARILQCCWLEGRHGRRRQVRMQIWWHFQRTSGAVRPQAAPSVHFETAALSALCAFGTRAAREFVGARHAN